jgi:hypothetical protein
VDLIRPRYGAGSLADVLPSVLAALGVQGPPERAPDPLGLAGGPLAGVRRVAVLLVDGLGTAQVRQASSVAPTLAALARDARTLTAGFPSTTPTSLVSVGTGTPPGAHGVIGFTVRVPGTRRVLTHIDWGADPDPDAWQPVHTQFEIAAAAGVSVSVASRSRFQGSGLSVAAYRGAAYRPADDTDALVVQMLAGLAEASPALVYGYHPDVDTAGHLFGLESPQWRAAVAEVDRLLARLLDGLPPDAALLVTADHGQLDIPGDHRVDLDADPRLRAGVDVVAGEPRVRYLHTTPGAADDVIAAWRAVLGDRAWVVSRAEAVATGWFGPVPEEHLARVGDVVVACHDRLAIMATGHEPELVSKLIAYHGSFTAAEMEIPLLVVAPG